MILYDLTCSEEHHFESWFRNSSVADKLIKAGQVVCPSCGSKKVHKAPMAPMIAKTGIAKTSDEASVPAEMESPQLAAAMEKAAEAFAELRKAVEKNYEDVGGKFPEEARRIHYGESQKRGIYGEATAKETKDLLDEGIGVLPLPRARRSQAN